MANAACELCNHEGGELVWRGEKLRIVMVADAHYPGFCRVIWNGHAKEMTDLPPPDRSLLLMTVCKVEQAIREVMRPDKVNLASLGNVVPHLHWHVIPRYADDAHFPGPVWAEVQRTPTAESLAARHVALPLLREALLRHVDQMI